MRIILWIMQRQSTVKPIDSGILFESLSVLYAQMSFLF